MLIKNYKHFLSKILGILVSWFLLTYLLTYGVGYESKRIAVISRTDKMASIFFEEEEI